MNIIKTDNYIIAFKNDLIEYIKSEIRLSIIDKNYTRVHSLIEIIAQLDLYNEDCLLEFNNDTQLRLIEEV